MKQQSWYVSVLGVLSALFLFSVFAQAQDYVYATGNPTFGVNYPITGGNIDVSNGNVHITIPLGTFQQRGNLQPITINLEYDSRIWGIIEDVYGDYSWQPTNVPSTMGGWRLTTGVENPVGNSSFAIGASQNGPYTCNGTSEDGSYNKYTDFVWTDSNGTMHTFDASVIQPGSGPACAPTGTGYAIDGSGYYLSISGNSTMTVYDTSGLEVFPWYEDGNGNKVVADYAGNVTDSMGRALVTTTVNGNTTTYAVLKEGGGTNAFTVHTETINANSLFQQSAVTEFNGSFTAIQSIDLPDGSSYSFTYDSGTGSGNYGELESMTLPTGGGVSLYYSNYLDSYKNENRWISIETENGNSTTFTPQVLTQCSSGGTGCQEQMTVSRPSGDSKVYTLTLNNGAWNSQAITYAGSPGSTSKLMTTTTNYNFGSYPCSDPSICTGSEFIKATSNQVTLDDTNQTASTVYNYSKPWTGRADSVQQYDYGVSGTPSRETDYTYGTVNNGMSVLSQVKQLLNGNAVSQASYSYDGNANLTGETDGLSGGAQATTSYIYDTNGMKTSMTDPCGNATCSDMTGTSHTTTYSYTCSDGFLQKITYPTTNGISHTTQVNPDCSSGLPLSTTDQNGQVTVYDYTSCTNGNGRICKISYPDGGQTTYSYPSANQVVLTRLLSASTSSVVTATADGYGRKSTVSLSDPAGNDTVTYAYDPDGRLQYTYNPERSTSSPTDGYTFTEYDALDRPSFIDSPSEYRITYAYSGNQVTVTDENSHQKQYTYDFFHDLTKVLEPNASGTPSWETDYTYDAAGHVLSVNQKGDGSSGPRTRTFVYDDLERMTSESTPEAGSKSYTYDANGNMATSSTGSGALTYQYDALNRRTAEQASGLTHNYYYDAFSGFTLQNAIGRLVREGNGVNANEVYSYDAMGRLNWEASETPSVLNDTAIITKATYDLAGDLSTLTYPDGRVITESYDSAQHLTGIQYTSWNGTNVGSSYYTASTFAPPGETTNATFGNNAVQLSASLNSSQLPMALSYQNTTQVLWSKQYTWANNAQNLLQVADMVNPIQTATYTYDQVNRLASASTPTSMPATSGSATVTINGSEQSTTIGTYASACANVTAQMDGQGTDTETGVPSPPAFPSVALNSADAITGTATIGYDIQTDLGEGIGTGSVTFQDSTNGGTSWATLWTTGTMHSDSNSSHVVSFGPISGLTNLSSLEIRLQATATGSGPESDISVSGATSSGGSNCPTATVALYDSGTVTATVNGHADSTTFQAGSTSATVAAALATAINNDSGSSVTATSAGYQLTVTSKTTGSSTNYPVSVSWTHSSNFSSPSFTLSAPVALSGGQNATSSNPNAFSETYTVDPWGNQQQSGNFNFVQPFSTNNQISVSGYSYDAAGDLTADGLGNTYTYNAEGMLTASNGASYVYDALDQRVATIGSSYPTETIYFAGQPIALHNATSGAWTDLIWAGGGMIAEVPGTQTGLPTYRLLDHEGSLVMTTDGSGNVTGTNLLTPYGEVLSSNTSDIFSFAGLVTDAENGSDHAWYRNFTTSQSRWLRPDPYNGSYDLTNPQSFNRYMYVNGNPLMYTDPSGQCGVYDLCVDVWASAILDINPITAAIFSGVIGVAEIGDLLGWWGGPPKFTGSLQPRPDCSKAPPSPPNAPPNANLAQNVQQASTMSTDQWVNNVREYGNWDYAHSAGQQYASFGNFNFGATCAAQGFPLVTCQQGAGTAAYGSAFWNLAFGSHKWTAGPGSPVSPANVNGVPDYGDQSVPSENPSVINGYNYQAWQQGCAQ